MPRTAQFNGQALAALAAKQHGVIARVQAVQSGMTERVLDYRIRGGGPWQVLVRARLPVPLFNPRLFVGSEFLAMPDCWWPELGVAAEADSRAWHFSPRDWEQTLARHARMSAHGIVVLHFPPRRIRHQRAEVADQIRRALVSGRKLPQILTIPSKADRLEVVGRRP